MIYLKVRGRLGNQFFQYATVKSIKDKFYPNEEIKLDFSDLKKLGTEESGYKNSLVDFNVSDYSTCKKIKCNFFQKIMIFIMRIPNPFFRMIGLEKKADIISYNFERFMQPTLNKFGIYYMIHGYYDFKPTKAKNKIFIGNFESDKYFYFNKSKITQMYTPLKSINDCNNELYNEITNNNSICITIRCGDFLNDATTKKIHYVCTPDYFYKAIDLIKEKVKNPVFVVFSDNVEWVKKNMNFGVKTFYETGKDPVWEKLYLMSKCKHFIISNSTFSWWAQYLSNNNERVVIAPKKWKNISYKKDSGNIDIYQKNWIKI